MWHWRGEKLHPMQSIQSSPYSASYTRGMTAIELFVRMHRITEKLCDWTIALAWFTFQFNEEGALSDLAWSINSS
jgi:hypothetical protein